MTYPKCSEIFFLKHNRPAFFGGLLSGVFGAGDFNFFFVELGDRPAFVSELNGFR